MIKLDPSGDAIVQVRLKPEHDAAVNEICADRGMKKRDLLGKVVRWFLRLGYDGQACILGHLTPEAQLLILDRVREAVAREAAKGAAPPPGPAPRKGTARRRARR